MQAPLPLTRDLVLIGGGHAHALVLRSWGMKPVPGVRLTVINPAPSAPYSGMLPGLIAGHYRRDQLEMDLVPLARHAGARLILGRAVGIDRAMQRVIVEGRPPVRYDVASLDIGVTSALPDVPGFAEHAVPAKPLADFAEAWEGYVARAVAGEVAPRVAVIGAGVAGVELALAARHRLAANGLTPEITLIDAGTRIMEGVGLGARGALKRALARQGVDVRLGNPAVRITAKGAVLEDGQKVPASLVIGAAGARPQPWLAETGLDLTDGFVTVDPFLRSVNDPAIYAAGDCAHLSHAPRPKAGVYAVREAPILLNNFKADLTGALRKPFRPQRGYLKLISMGDKTAAADRLGSRLEGEWVWAWKDRIDRDFMDQFKRLPFMDTRVIAPANSARGVREMLGGRQQPCGGCAAKPGHETLQGALADLADPQRDDVLAGPGDDAAVLAHGNGAQVFTTDHLRSLTEDPYVMARIAAVHAMGDVWAMGGKPQAVLSNLILPRMAERMSRATLTEILDGAAEVVRAAGADLAGGHTSTGPELTVGFSVTGLVDGPVIGLKGAQPGDALILTKPIGSGTIMAAEMQKKATGAEVLAALEIMQTPSATASEVLAEWAHAMTDVTGYGLAGHLLGMLRASRVAAELDEVPYMEGAVRLAEMGIRSTAFAENARFAVDIPGVDLQEPHTALLFDPQTAGGLLAAVPGERAADVLGELADRDVAAWRIGRLYAGAPAVTFP
ncbi:selenide,water dikinase [Rhodovulum iodosum]|uniref:Selenide,water dikinase n=1 Tax=Rhodovulum iodosum TaxID=68291 RepID=A0ABV3XS24_9RHOB|nr:selenide, water dikinase SelD [Rhodovulum robiginosum]RSK30466.1 selenide, water dikinase SelD [Rhodovulum robiginosum]